MHILITNDDGYLAPGIKALTQDAGEDNHLYAIEYRTDSVTPMQIDLPCHRGIHPLKNWLDAL